MKRSADRQGKIASRHKDKVMESMQRKITMIIATDFFCWMPIVLMSIYSISGCILFSYILNLRYFSSSK